ncbi:amidohydrolase family protein [Mucilaginibacter sp. RS28]|uniref:Amidohydrolase family protein n=1 Tax=Mucilaginibacter straminoryzae TaxID=2932774 RepID=A0A9X1X6K8_9SPHI|nr:amidohydrolase family protein [Mucilaginibacter straminoryzae]MCJ8210613.1 amidohydrolase family protein [Mucilaginibacter straminoryzae]
MKKKILFSFGGLLLSTVLAFGQANILPAKAQAGPVVITGATIHVGNGRVINNGYIAFDKGKITAVGEGAAPSVAGATVVDATGKQVYPGFICPVTSLGLVEFESVRATDDETETGDLNPHIRSLIAFNTDSKVIPTVRSNGIVLAQPTPEGGTISGQSSVMMLDGWNWEDAAYKKDMAIHLTWPVARQAGGRRAFFAQAQAQQESPAERAQKAIDAINDLFAQAQAYAAGARPAVTNLRLEAMRGLFNGTKKLFVNAEGAKEIEQAVNFAKKYGISAVIVGGNESYLVADLLKQNNVPVIIKETQALPAHDEDDVYLPYKLPHLLQDAGVLYGLTGVGFWRQRNLPFEAGQAVGYGLTKEQAISMITLNNAKILGIDKTTGSLEVGKDANLFVSAGDALDMLTLDVTNEYIQGRNVNLDNLHKQLYKRYSEKYNTPVKL